MNSGPGVKAAFAMGATARAAQREVLESFMVLFASNLAKVALYSGRIHQERVDEDVEERECNDVDMPYIY